MGVIREEGGKMQVGVTYIGVFSVYMQYNCVYYCDMIREEGGKMQVGVAQKGYGFNTTYT
jgi:hypothetical protein